MAILSQKQSYKWIIIVSFISIILVPSMIQSPTFKTTSVLGLGAVCLLFEFLSLKSLNSGIENYKSEVRQTLILIVLTIILIVVNFLV
jgi:hypothetical protein